MIKEIFLPEKIGNKRIYSQIILGFAIEETLVTCVKVIAKRSKNIIEKTFSAPIEQGDLETYTQRAAQTIKIIISQVDKYDQIRICVPASLVIFKELEVPFKDADKIRMVLEYEVEPMLPFSIDEAIFDFIITHQVKEENNTRVLVAAIRNHDIENVLNIYTIAGIQPKNITIDLFASYGLYQQIPEYQNLPDATTLVELGSHSTRVALLQKGELRLSRIIPRGFLTIAKSVSDETKIPLEKVEELLKTNGIAHSSDDVFDKSIEKHVMNFFNDIQFTLNSFSLKIPDYKGLSKILFTGHYSTIKGLTKFCANLFQIPCEVFSVEKLFLNNNYKNKIKDLHINFALYLTAIGIAIPSIQQCEFDLRRKDFELIDQKSITNQLATATTLLFLIFVILIVNGYFQISTLSNEISRIEIRETNKLKKILPKDIKLPKQITLKNLSQKAEGVLNDKLEQWKPFEKSGIKPLVILQELTNIIDKRRFDVNVENVSMEQEEGSIKVEVEGIFKSKTGKNQYEYFHELENRFSESAILKLWYEKEDEERKVSNSIEPKLVDDKIKFTAKLRYEEL